MTTLPAEPFGPMPDGRGTSLYTLQNDRLRARITDFGGRMVSLEAPDRHGRSDHVLLGFDSADAYIRKSRSFGTLLGRYANRIAGGSLTLDGTTCTLSRNSGANTLHGGAEGFSHHLWAVTTAATDPLPTLVLTHISADGDQGFPGEVTVQATYQLDADTLSLSFEATTTRPTVINLSVHPYFNLGGLGCRDVLSHEVTIAADAFLPTGADQIPTGEIRPVAGTPFDFRAPTALGARIRQPDEQLFHGLGYDHCFVLRRGDPAMRVVDPVSGRALEVHTDQPGLQVYTANKLTGSFAGHGEVTYRQSAGLALEPQDFPDAPNHPNFPSTVLRPGQTYRRFIRYRFTAA
jgi:aldose 1-epimerase